MQFLDDTLFFAKPFLQNVICMKAILRCFELVSDLWVNIHKSKLASVGVESRAIGTYASLLNCGTTNISFMYLGIPINANPHKEAA